MATAKQWWEGTRPRTLPAAVAPVAVGTGAAVACGQARPERAALALVVALALQIGVNFANDYSDGVRGTDDDRVGPLRLTASGAARPRSVLAAALGSFTVGSVAGLALVALSGAWWLLLVGVGCLLGAWYYTGGRHPYGYAGLGEIAVFVFFGLVAVLGTTYTQAGHVGTQAIASAVAVGALAAALLVTNNLRDLPTDTLAGKRTLAVRLGDTATRNLYLGLLALAAVATVAAALTRPGALLGLGAALGAIAPIRTVRAGATGRDLLVVLRDTGRLELLYAALLTTGLSLG